MNYLEIIELIKKLSPNDKNKIYDFLFKNSDFVSEDETAMDELTNIRNKDGYCCVHCKSNNVYRNGQYKSKMGVSTEIKRQRYYCKDCKKTYTETTSTPLFRTRKIDKWYDFVKCMLEGFSLRKSAEIIGDIHFVTLFYWRHKILCALTQIDFDQFTGIVEFDETYILHSKKGVKHNLGRKPRKRGGSSKYRGISREQVCVLVARDRSKITYSKVIGMGRIDSQSLDNAIGNKLTSNNIICTDGWRAFRTYAKDKHLEFHSFKSNDKQRVKGLFHIQNVNSYHSRLKKWLRHFNGVSSKYLNCYLAWFQFLEVVNNRSDINLIKKMLLESCLQSITLTKNEIRLAKFVA